MNYPVSDMVVRIKNAYKAGKENVNIPYSGLKENLCEILKKKGFIEDYSIENADSVPLKSIKVKLACSSTDSCPEVLIFFINFLAFSKPFSASLKSYSIFIISEAL